MWRYFLGGRGGVEKEVFSSQGTRKSHSTRKKTCNHHSVKHVDFPVNIIAISLIAEEWYFAKSGMELSDAVNQ